MSSVEIGVSYVRWMGSPTDFGAHHGLGSVLCGSSVKVNFFRENRRETVYI